MIRRDRPGLIEYLSDKAGDVPMSSQRLSLARGFLFGLFPLLAGAVGVADFGRHPRVFPVLLPS
ncbi:hypothetical protein D3C80_1839180 [compost metagenome]